MLGGYFYAVNVACLDDVTTEELAESPGPLRGRQKQQLGVAAG
jgi:hypothetical protein